MRANKPWEVVGFYPVVVPEVASGYPRDCNGAMIERLRNRRQFLRIASANRKWVTAGIVLQAAPQPPDDRAVKNGTRYGVTVSKRVGNAVERNRARRRLRAIAEEILPHSASTGYDIVLIGRKETLRRNYLALGEDLKTGLEKLGALRK